MQDRPIMATQELVCAQLHHQLSYCSLRSLLCPLRPDITAMVDWAKNTKLSTYLLLRPLSIYMSVYAALFSTKRLRRTSSRTARKEGKKERIAHADRHLDSRVVHPANTRSNNTTQEGSPTNVNRTMHRITRSYRSFILKATAS